LEACNILDLIDRLKQLRQIVAMFVGNWVDCSESWCSSLNFTDGSSSVKLWPYWINAASVVRETVQGIQLLLFCKRRKLPQPEAWEGDEERIRHITQQDKQVIEYAKKLETRRKGNYLTKAVEQDESNDSGVDEE